MTTLLVLVMLAADGGAARLDVKQLVEKALVREKKARDEGRSKWLAELKRKTATASADERALLERAIHLVEVNEPPDKLVPLMGALLRDAAKLSRGSFEDERAIGAAFLTLPATARSAGLDPSPWQAEATAYAKDLVVRYPMESRSHALLAAGLIAPDEQLAALGQLKLCAALDPKNTSCAEQHKRIAAELERPECDGASTTQPLTAWGARDASTNDGGTPLVVDGQKVVLEPQPILQASSFRRLVVDANGDLAIETTGPGMERLEGETRRLSAASGFVVLRLGDEVLLAARVLEPIKGGRVRVTHGKTPFSLEKLCKTIKRPTIPEELRLP